VNSKKGVIAILTGGGDVPGLNPAIRAVTIAARREGYEVIGIRRGWGGLIDMIPDAKADNAEHYQVLTNEVVNRAGRTGGTFLHSSRTRPSHVKKSAVPVHLKDQYAADVNDLTPHILKNLAFLGVDYVIPIGGDDTLSYGVRLYKEGVKVVAIPKTMDNDVPGTDYCAPAPAPTSASWSWRSSAATPGSPRSCPPWPGPPTAASSPSTSSTWSSSPSSWWRTATATPPSTRC